MDIKELHTIKPIDFSGGSYENEYVNITAVYGNGDGDLVRWEMSWETAEKLHELLSLLLGRDDLVEYKD